VVASQLLWVLACQLGRIDSQIDPRSQVMVLVNEAVPESSALGETYAARRGVPTSRILRVHASVEEEISWKEFREQILVPFGRFVGDKPEIVCCAVVYGVPVRVAEENTANDNPAGAEGDGLSRGVVNRDHAAVDRELELARIEHPIEGWVRHPLYGADAPVTPASRVILVCRLDGPTPQAVRALIDHAFYGEALGIVGRHTIDLRGLTEGPQADVDASIGRIAGVFERAGMPLNVERTAEVLDLSRLAEPAHYWGWMAGSMRASAPFAFARGAVGVHLHGLSASPLRSAVRGWVGPMVAHGITATSGAVYEPTAAGFPDGAIFFDRFLAGYSFAESMAFATMFSSWVTVNVGDPLYAPYGRSARERQAANLALLRQARGELEAQIDAGAAAELGPLEPLTALLEADDPLLSLVREARVREAAPAGSVRGTIAKLRAALEAGDWAGALRLSPGNFEANLGEGRRLLERGQVPAALGCARRACAADPRSASAQALLARALLAAGKPDEALPAAQVAWSGAFAPEHYRLLAEIHTARKDYAAAVEPLESLVRLDPAEVNRAIDLGRAYLAAGRGRDALRVLAPVPQELPADPAAAARLEQVYGLLERGAAAGGETTLRGECREILRQWSQGRVPEAEVRRADRAIAALEAQRSRAELAPLASYESAPPGLPRVWIASRSTEPVELWICGPTARSARLRPFTAGGPEPVEAWVLWPGIYRVAAAVGTGEQRRILTRRQRIEAGRHYALGIDETGAPYRPERPR
jgi:uncharacterized protein (TIGR03790 family)